VQPKEVQPQQGAAAAMTIESQTSGEQVKSQPGAYSVEASSMLFTKPAKVGARLYLAVPCQPVGPQA
jgi:hypothetical protein